MYDCVYDVRIEGARPYINNTHTEDIVMAKATKKKTTTKKKTAKRKPNAAFMKPLKPSAALAELVGSSPLPRTQVVKKLWAYIKKNDLQDKKNRRNIVPDTKMQAVFGKKTFSMFEMNKIVAKHLS